MTTAISVMASVILLFVILAYHHSTLGEMMSEVQDAVDAVVAELLHAKEEIVDKIADVEAQLAAAQVPADVVDLSALKAAADALEAIVPDAPVAVVDEVPVVVDEAPVVVDAEVPPAV